MSQFTDFSWRKPTKCLILKTTFCRLVHIYTHVLNLILTATCRDVHRFRHAQPVFPCAPHLQLWEQSLTTRFPRWLSSTLLNEKIVFSACKTRETCMYLSEGGNCVYIFRPCCTDITSGLWLASYIRWCLSFREALWSVSQICSSVPQDETKRKKERNTFLT